MILVSALVFILFISLLLFVWRKKISRPTHAGGVVHKIENGVTLFLVVTASSGKHKWVLPKGKIENNETPEAAAAREVLEETGVSARCLKKAGTVNFTRKGKRVNVIYFFMEFEHFHGASKEDRLIEWMEKKEAIERLGIDNVKNILRRL